MELKGAPLPSLAASIYGKPSVVTASAVLAMLYSAVLSIG
jgi:hypothetical protein